MRLCLVAGLFISMIEFLLICLPLCFYRCGESPYAAWLKLKGKIMLHGDKPQLKREPGTTHKKTAP
jgi:hypothetical protein